MKGLWSEHFAAAEKPPVQADASPSQKMKPPAPLGRYQSCLICPSCNAAICLRTSGSSQNPGRNYYACPSREHKFFKWADEVKAEELIDVPYCGGCNAGVCRVRREKTGPNAGRILFMCSVKEGDGSCGYRVWKDELEKMSTIDETTASCNETAHTNIDDLAEGSNGNDNNGADNESPVIDSSQNLQCLEVTSKKMDQLKCREHKSSESSKRPPKRSRYGDLKDRGPLVSARSFALHLPKNSVSRHCWIEAAISQNLSSQLQGWWGRLAFGPMPFLMPHTSKPFTICMTIEESKIDKVEAKAHAKETKAQGKREVKKRKNPFETFAAKKKAERHEQGSQSTTLSGTPLRVGLPRLEVPPPLPVNEPHGTVTAGSGSATSTPRSSSSMRILYKSCKPSEVTLPMPPPAGAPVWDIPQEFDAQELPEPRANYVRLLNGPLTTPRLVQAQDSLRQERHLFDPNEPLTMASVGMPLPEFDPKKRLVPQWEVMHDSSIISKPRIPRELVRGIVLPKDRARAVERSMCHNEDQFCSAVTQLCAAFMGTLDQNVLNQHEREKVENELLKISGLLHQNPLGLSSPNPPSEYDDLSANLRDTIERAKQEHSHQLAEQEKAVRAHVQREIEAARQEGYEKGKADALEDHRASLPDLRVQACKDFLDSQSFKELRSHLVASEAIPYFYKCLDQLKAAGAIHGDQFDKVVDPLKTSSLEDAPPDPSADEEVEVDEFEPVLAKFYEDAPGA